ncbi:MAG: hypothetical protein A3D28_04890 [Omnitrophica bacterium RIFCSPHIGHO2_02_FULL_63_14]|nr:MAG: hypothetical protein A3D28_04890 [Omnitrophica bacterium RIFCSPHIGHO2_02_FULL_63_14]
MKRLVWLMGCGLLFAAPLSAEEPAAQDHPPTSSTTTTSSSPAELPEPEPPHMEAIVIPADPELERQIDEVQDALAAIYQQMVRRREALKKTQDPTAKATLYEEFERLRKDRDDLEALLHDLVDEAKLSQQTVIDDALARARWLERQQEHQQQKEEIIRDRQQ